MTTPRPFRNVIGLLKSKAPQQMVPKRRRMSVTLKARGLHSATKRKLKVYSTWYARAAIATTFIEVGHGSSCERLRHVVTTPLPSSFAYDTASKGSDNPVHTVAITVNASIPESFNSWIRSLEKMFSRVCAIEEPSAHSKPSKLHSTSVALAMETPMQTGSSDI